VPLSDETDSARTIFATTQWTVVLASAESQAPGASAALTHLCQTYWKPLFGYVRQRGYPVHEAQDLVQDFFVYLLEKRVLAHADRTRGRFRTFLLTCLQNFLTSAYRHANTQRRGGDVEVVPLDSQAIDEMERASTRAGSDPVEAFDAAWAQAVFDRAIARLRTEADDRGRVLELAAPRALLRSADDHRCEAEAAPHEERARALRPAELVRGDRAEVGVERRERDGHVADGRARVDVHEDRPFAQGRADVGHRLERADLVVRQLHAHERGVGPHRVDDLVS